jgi:hypothetical protein
MSLAARFEMGALAFVGSVVIRCLGHSWRIGEEGLEMEVRAREHAPNVIFAFWHGRLLPLCFTHRNRAIQVLASEHRDGERIGQTIRRLGFGHVRGSSTRGGTRAIFDLMEKLRAGFDLGITVEGAPGAGDRGGKAGADPDRQDVGGGRLAHHRGFEAAQDLYVVGCIRAAVSLHARPGPDRRTGHRPPERRLHTGGGKAPGARANTEVHHRGDRP